MPTAPTITTTINVIGENPYGLTPADDYSTWGRCRTTVVKLKDSFSVGGHSLVLDEGFYPSDGLFLRVDRWPQINPTTSDQIGQIYGFIGLSPDSYITLGKWFSDSPGDWYSGGFNDMDENDMDSAFNGATLTYNTSSTVTATTDFYTLQSDPGLSVYGGQQVAGVTITSIDGISGFTAF
jgi:hypothetical protein